MYLCQMNANEVKVQSFSSANGEMGEELGPFLVCNLIGMPNSKTCTVAIRNVFTL